MNKKKFVKAFIILALVAVCAYTVWFGTIKNPVDYTMSTIGNYFGQRSGFILWGAVTGILLVSSISHIYKTAGCNDVSSDRFLALSFAFLIMTVLIPNVKEVSWAFFFIHVASSVLFACSLLISILFFMRHLYLTKRDLFQKALKLLITCLAIPLATIAGYGKLTGVTEMSFFVCISLFMLVINSHLEKYHAAKALIK